MLTVQHTVYSMLLFSSLAGCCCSCAAVLTLLEHPGLGHLAIGLRNGVIQLVTKAPVGASNTAANVVSTFLDISSRVAVRGEQGLLGMAFHPNFNQNGRFFVSYICKAADCVVSAPWYTSPSTLYHCVIVPLCHFVTVICLTHLKCIRLCCEWPTAWFGVDPLVYQGGQEHQLHFLYCGC